MSGPLDDLVVIDLGQVYNGPYCTMLLARLGADVIKVEPPGGEPVRRRPGEQGQSHAFSMLNGGKRGIELDLKSREGRTALLALVERADVLVENFAPGVMDRLGIGHDVLRGINPRLIVASGKGYASTGPYSGYRAMDLTVQAMTGVLSATGFSDQPPVKSGAAVADFSAGAHLAIGVLAALHRRDRTGEGGHVEVPMHDALVPMLTSGLAGLLDDGGAKPERTGNHHGGMAYCPYNVYPASDGWIAVLCLTDRHWQRLCEVMGRPELADDPGYADNARRVARMEELDAVVGAWTARSTRAQLFTLVQDAQIPTAPVHTLAEVLADPQLEHSGMLTRVEHPKYGVRYLYGNPIRMEGLPPWRPAAAPELGEHTDEVLRELGLPSDE